MGKQQNLHLCYGCMLLLEQTHHVIRQRIDKGKCANCEKTKWGAYCTITKKCDKMGKNND